jgi:hypothetical protein
LTTEKVFKKTACRYFALKRDVDSVTLEQGDRVDDLKTLLLLDETLEQSDRFLNEEQ